MNAPRIAKLLRELADAFDEGPKDDAPAPPPAKREPPRVDELAMAKARKALRKKGFAV